jgi:hypothetical protein
MGTQARTSLNTLGSAGQPCTGTCTEEVSRSERAVMDHQCGGPAGRQGHDSRRGAKTCAPTAGREGNHPRWQPAEPLAIVPNPKWHRVKTDMRALDTPRSKLQTRPLPSQSLCSL